MNAAIKKHFEDIEIRFLESSVVSRYENIRQEIGPKDGKLRIKARLLDENTAQGMQPSPSVSDVLEFLEKDLQ